MAGTPVYMSPEQAGAKDIESTAGPTYSAWASCSSS